MDLERPVTDEEWAQYFGEVRSASFENSRARQKRIAHTVDKVAAGTCCKEEIDSRETNFRYRFWTPPRMPNVSSIAKGLTKFCAKMRSISAEEREKLERPILESLARKPKIPIAQQDQLERAHVASPSYPSRKRKRGRRKLVKSASRPHPDQLMCKNPRLLELSSLLSPSSNQTDSSRFLSDSLPDTTLQTLSSSANSTLNDHRSVSDLFSTHTELGFSRDGASYTQSSSRSTLSNTDQSIWSRSVTSRAENGSEESDLELDVTSPPSERRQAHDQSGGHDPPKQKNKTLTKRRMQQPATDSTGSQSTAKAQRSKIEKMQHNSGRKTQKAGRKLSDGQLSSTQLNTTAKVQSWINKNKILTKPGKQRPATPSSRRQASAKAQINKTQQKQYNLRSTQH